MRSLGPMLLLAAACSRSHASTASRTEPFLLGGIQVNELDHGHWIDTLDRAGLHTVSTTVYARQGDWDSADLSDEDAPSVIDEIREAKRAGLSVVLVLRVALDHAYPRNRYLWHGMIMPKDEPTLAGWFRRYRAFARRWAEIAEREGVDVLAVGSEMNALASTTLVDRLPPLEAYYLSRTQQAEYLALVTRFRERILPRHLAALGGSEMETPEAFTRERAAVWEAWARSTTFGGDVTRIDARARQLDREWRDLIHAVRNAYHGTITYAANFDQYRRVGFWDELDLIGINAYFPLRSDLGPADEPTLEYGWARVLDEIDRFRHDRGLGARSVLFTELGYTYRRRSTLEPWSQRGFSLVRSGKGYELVTWADEPQDLSERAMAVRALGRVQRSLHPGMLAGVLYWKLSTDRMQLPLEPFVMIIGEDPVDPMQSALLDLPPP